jgi:hypothetical protein
MPQTSVLLVVVTPAGTVDKFILEDRNFAALPFFPPVQIQSRPFWKDSAKQETDSLYDVFTVTEAADYVLDCKSEGSVLRVGSRYLLLLLF